MRFSPCGNLFIKPVINFRWRKKTLPVSPITVKIENKNITIYCQSDVFLGSTHKSTCIESISYPLLFNQLLLLSPPSSPFTIPSSDALQAGFSDGAVIPSKARAKLFLMGSSILGGCVGTITESAQNSGFEGLDLCKGGDYLKKHRVC